jgi:hypothetical protein
MKRFVLCIALLLGIGLSGQQAQAADDLEFATPVVVATSPACELGECSTAQSVQSHVAHHRVRRPIARWFQQRRPVRRALRAVVTFVGHPCCR